MNQGLQSKKVDQKIFADNLENIQKESECRISFRYLGNGIVVLHYWLWGKNIGENALFFSKQLGLRGAQRLLL